MKKFYHVSTNSNINKFVPRIPLSVGDDENNTVPRVCIAENFNNCIKAAPISQRDMYLMEKRKKEIYLYEFIIDENDSSLIKTEQVVEQVWDAVNTKEYWYLKTLTPSKVYSGYVDVIEGDTPIDDYYSFIQNRVVK